MIKEGIRARMESIVTEDKTAEAMFSGELPVFATPAMAALMEEAAWRSVAPYLDFDETTVGTRLNMRHMSSTPLGMEVACESVLTEVDGRKLTFHITAFDETGMIGEAEHERFIVKKERFLAKAEEKRK